MHNERRQVSHIDNKNQAQLVHKVLTNVLQSFKVQTRRVSLNTNTHSHQIQ